MTMQEDGGRKTQQRDNPLVKTGRSDELGIFELKQAQTKHNNTREILNGKSVGVKKECKTFVSTSTGASLTSDKNIIAIRLPIRREAVVAHGLGCSRHGTHAR